MHFSQASVKALANAPEWLAGLLQLRENCYLDFVPQYYASNGLIKAVVDCTLAQAQNVLSPHPAVSTTQVLQLYGKALRTLQAALQDSELRLQPEVLCATQILALYEVRTI